jgi:microcystin-dependent protein
MTPYVGAIFAFGFNFPPQGWMTCNGSLISISEYQALFSLIGTTYGGDGVSTFAIPNMNGRVPIGAGQGTGLSNYVLGQRAGTESVTLTSNNLPSHTHAVISAKLPVSANSGELNDPTNAYFGISDNVIGTTYTDSGNSTTMGANPVAQTGVAGSSMPINILNPLLTVNYCIAVEGIFPPRN